jgi:hypothetical protein
MSFDWRKSVPEGTEKGKEKLVDTIGHTYQEGK